MRKKLIAGNWKLFNNAAQTAELVKKIAGLVQGVSGVDVAIAPVFTSLHAAKEAIGSSGIILSAQDVYFEEKGAFTGEIAPSMLVEAGCKMVIIGHSERRQYFGETEETVNKKAKAALRSGLAPIICVGETLAHRETGKTFEVISAQLAGGLAGLDLKTAVIAYEPVWAIGTGRNATSQQAQEVHAFIRGWIKSNFGDISKEVRVLYGGSVKPSNAKELLACPDVDGALVGGASLIAEDFSAIIRLSV